MPKDRSGNDDSPNRLSLTRAALLALAAFTCAILLQVVIFFGLAGVPVNAPVLFMILAPAAVGVAILLLAVRQG
jgi:hypothetical protein